MSIELLRFKNLSKNQKIINFITTRNGGVSEGDYKSLNFGLHVGDKINDVLENRKRLAEAVGISELNFTFSEQVHGGGVAVVTGGMIGRGAKDYKNSIKGADALITNLKNACLVILTADCVPILLYDPINQIIGAAHAGWRGTVKNIAGNTARKMVKKFECDPKNILVGIGPAICKNCFKVDKETAQKFDKKFVEIKENEFVVDLIAENIDQLIKIGILRSNIETVDICTKENPNKFFSARTDGINTGRIASGIFLK